MAFSTDIGCHQFAAWGVADLTTFCGFTPAAIGFRAPPLNAKTQFAIARSFPRSLPRRLLQPVDQGVSDTSVTAGGHNASFCSGGSRSDGCLVDRQVAKNRQISHLMQLACWPRNSASGNRPVVFPHPAVLGRMRPTSQPCRLNLATAVADSQISWSIAPCVSLFPVDF